MSHYTNAAEFKNELHSKPHRWIHSILRRSNNTMKYVHCVIQPSGHFLVVGSVANVETALSVHHQWPSRTEPKNLPKSGVRVWFSIPARFPACQKHGCQRKVGLQFLMLHATHECINSPSVKAAEPWRFAPVVVPWQGSTCVYVVCSFTSCYYLGCPLVFPFLLFSVLHTINISIWLTANTHTPRDVWSGFWLFYGSIQPLPGHSSLPSLPLPASWPRLGTRGVFPCGHSREWSQELAGVVSYASRKGFRKCGECDNL